MYARMGTIIREFRCGDCASTFESTDPVEEVVCPSCTAQEAERVFLTPPGIKSPQTSVADRELKNLAADFGLSNISNKDGAPVKSAPTGDAAPKFAPQNPATMQVLSKLGRNADGFSGLLPSLQRAGRPHQWHKQPINK